MSSFKDWETIIPGPKVIGPPMRLTILEPLLRFGLVPMADSRRLMATFIAAPTHLAGLVPLSTGHGSH